MARSIDFIIAIAVTVLAPVAYEKFSGVNVGDVSRYLIVGALAGALFVFVNEFRGEYRSERIAFAGWAWTSVAFNWIGVWFFFAVFGFSLKASGEFSRVVVFSAALGGLPAIAVFRLLFSYQLERDRRSGARPTQRVALLSLGKSKRVTPDMRRSFALVQRWIFSGAVDEFDAVGFVSLARARRAEKIVIHAAPEDLHAVPQLIERLRDLPLPVFVMLDEPIAHLFDRPRRISGDLTAYEVRGAPLTRLERAAKRGLDLAVSSTALLLLMPIMLIAAVAVKLSSPGPVLFRQHRLGFNGKPFKILKFRSMTVQENGASIVQATKGDARVTAVGRILRASSIDELPQLVNVLLGDMSLVGPRPHAVAHDTYFDDLIGDYSLRRHMKPGLTGWAQINGSRGPTPTVESMERRVALDLWYINHWSIFLDFWILMLTAVELIRNRDVH